MIRLTSRKMQSWRGAKQGSEVASRSQISPNQIFMRRWQLEECALILLTWVMWAFRVQLQSRTKWTDWVVGGEKSVHLNYRYMYMLCMCTVSPLEAECVCRSCERILAADSLTFPTGQNRLHLPATMTGAGDVLLSVCWCKVDRMFIFNLLLCGAVYQLSSFHSVEQWENSCLWARCQSVDWSWVAFISSAPALDRSQKLFPRAAKLAFLKMQPFHFPLKALKPSPQTLCPRVVVVYKCNFLRDWDNLLVVSCGFFVYLCTTFPCLSEVEGHFSKTTAIKP